jgi:hypothetical protein
VLLNAAPTSGGRRAPIAGARSTAAQQTVIIEILDVPSAKNCQEGSKSESTRLVERRAMNGHRMRIIWRRRIKRMFPRLLAASIFFIPACFASAQQLRPASEVDIVQSPVGSGPEDTTYEIHSGSCRIRWTVSRAGVNQGVAQHRAECRLPLSEQIALNAKILDQVVEREPTFRTLFLGRLRPFP